MTALVGGTLLAARGLSEDDMLTLARGAVRQRNPGTKVRVGGYAVGVFDGKAGRQ